LLITALGMGEDAYGAAIREVIETHTGEKYSIVAIYTTIDRLAQCTVSVKFCV
jgi:PadR family transcriptional regulator PadR